MRNMLYGAFAALALALAGQAAAVPVITTGGQAAGDGSGLTTSVDGAIVETFDLDGAGAFTQPWSWVTSDDPNPNIVQGSSPGTFAAPFGNTTYYYSVAATASGWARVDFGATYDYLGLYWGSIDDYNSIDLFDGETLVATIFGEDVLIPADGDQGASGSAYVNITGLNFTAAQFNSTQFAFEFDNLAVARVPEPGSLALIGAGIAGIGLISRRRRRQ